MNSLLSVTVALALSVSSALSLGDVLRSVEKTHPGLEKAQQSVKKAQGKKQAATGAWDPQVSVRGQRDPLGYYQTERIDAVVRQFTPFLGASVFGGYRLGAGNFAVYKGDLETLSDGELRAGIEVPLWKDGPIDARRAEIQKTAFRMEGQMCALKATQLKVTLGAAKAYWKWVAAGQEVRIQEELLSVAQTRDSGLRDQAKEGKLASIVVVDNERLVLDRKAKLLDAQRDFASASFNLSLFYRDENKTPIVAPRDTLPQGLPTLDDGALPDESDDMNQAFQLRPELCLLSQELAEAKVEVDFSENQRAPGIHASAYASRDFGVGPERYAPTELGLGLRLEMPLLLTKARGDLAAARADVRSLEALRREARDEILAQVRQARVEVLIARDQATLAAQQVLAARRLAEAERMRFAEGASELVVVNLRELAEAEAERMEVKALEAYQSAKAEYLTALGKGVTDF